MGLFKKSKKSKRQKTNRREPSLKKKRSKAQKPKSKLRRVAETAWSEIPFSSTVSSIVSRDKKSRTDGFRRRKGLVPKAVKRWLNKSVKRQMAISKSLRRMRKIAGFSLKPQKQKTRIVRVRR